MRPVIASLADRPDLRDALWNEELQNGWPTFMRQDPTGALIYGQGRFESLEDHVFVAVDAGAPDTVIARAVSVPFAFGTAVGRPELPLAGWDAVARWADEDARLGRTPDAFSAIEILVHRDHRRRGLSGRLIDALRDNAARHGARALYAPVRPSEKHREPHTPMNVYAARIREDGLPADAWLRVHVRAGGRIVGVAPCSMTIPGTLADWRSWTGLPLDRSGDVVVPGALAPVHVSLEHDHAVYVESNVWVHHEIAGNGGSSRRRRGA